MLSGSVNGGMVCLYVRVRVIVGGRIGIRELFYCVFSFRRVVCWRDFELQREKGGVYFNATTVRDNAMQQGGGGSEELDDCITRLMFTIFLLGQIHVMVTTVFNIHTY
jgi:hypothetical protein